MRKNNKGFTPIIILIVVLVVALIIGAYYLGANKNSLNLTPTPSTTPDLTANWKTYNDSLYSFKYPGSWTVKGQKDNYFGQWISIKNANSSVVVNVTPIQYPYGFEGSQPSSVVNNLNINIGGIAYQVKENIIGNTKAYVDFVVGKYHILFGTGYPAGEDRLASLSDYQSSRDTIIQILSTFQFMTSASQTDTSNWKTYTNTTYHMSFKYPSNLSQFGSISGPTNGTLLINLGDKSTAMPNTGAAFNGFDVYVVSNTQNSPLSQYLTSEISGWNSSMKEFRGSNYTPNTQQSPIQVGSQSGVILTNIGDGVDRLYTSFPDNQNFLVIGKNQSTTDFATVFNQILSTFQFTQ